MIKHYQIDGIEHIVATCTAVAYSAGDTEADRQDALCIAFKEDGKWFACILFDPCIEFPKTAAALEKLCTLDSTWCNISTALEDFESIRNHEIPSSIIAAIYSRGEGA